MPFKTSYNAGLGQPPINLLGVDTAPKYGVAIGTILKGFDDLLGEAEFIYLPGAANVIAGDHVVYDLLPGAVSVSRSSVAANANTGWPSAVAVAAVPAGSFGWYQISGVAVVNVAAGSAAGRAFLTATAGQLSNSPQAGSQLLGARLSTAIGTPAAGQSYMTITRPSVQGQIT